MTIIAPKEVLDEIKAFDEAEAKKRDNKMRNIGSISAMVLVGGMFLNSMKRQHCVSQLYREVALNPSISREYRDELLGRADNLTLEGDYFTTLDMIPYHCLFTKIYDFTPKER